MSETDWATLDAALIAAHERGETEELISLYRQASDAAAAAGKVDEAAFFATHAWIFALEAGDARAPELRDRLAAWGRVSGDET